MKFDTKNIDKKVLLNLFKNMLKSRMIEEKMIVLLRQGKVSKWFSGIGQEAISTGVTLALENDEYILPMHRNLSVFTSRDIPLDRLLLKLDNIEGALNGDNQTWQRIAMLLGWPKWLVVDDDDKKEVEKKKNQIKIKPKIKLKKGGIKVRKRLVIP